MQGSIAHFFKQPFFEGLPLEINKFFLHGRVSLDEEINLRWFSNLRRLFRCSIEIDLLKVVNDIAPAYSVFKGFLADQCLF